jgi:hypothetical protein
MRSESERRRGRPCRQSPCLADARPLHGPRREV